MGFADILGHDRAKGLLETAVREDRLPPALLLSGPEGIGKRTLAVVTARALLCETRTACAECAACRRVERGMHPDAFTIVREGAWIKVDAVRTVMREAAARPFEARARTFLVDDAHAMNEQAQNALLKSLEEPPPTSHLLLVTHAPQGLLPTIRSRCQVLRLGPLPARLLEQRLRDQGVTPSEAHLRAALCGGSLGAALAFQSEAFQDLREELLAVLESSPGWGAIERMEAAGRLAETDDLALALTALRALLRDVAALAAGGSPERLLNADRAPRLDALARARLGAVALELAAEVAQLREDLKTNASKPLLADVLLDMIARARAA